MALKDLGLPGFEIWDTWSQLSLEKYDPKDAMRVGSRFSQMERRTTGRDCWGGRPRGAPASNVC
jgi:hypothetical protein